MEAKRARRLKRITGTTRGKVRGPVTRGKARATLMNEGERRIFAMIDSTSTPSTIYRDYGPRLRRRIKRESAEAGS